jgi:hypothetical protein
VAQFAYTSTAIQDTAIQWFVDQYNLQNRTALTARQYISDLLTHWLDARVSDYRDKNTQSRGQLYLKATPEDQASIDTILAKYQ